MITGTATVTAPAGSAERAAVLGLLGTSPLSPGQTKKISLADLTARLRVRGEDLTPGAVAAHAVGRPLGQSAAARARAAARLVSLRQLRERLLAALPANARLRPGPEQWASLLRHGWVSRLAAHPEPERLLAAAAAALGGLPSSGYADRRLLAHAVAGDPHALDSATDLGGLVLAEATACGAMPAGLTRRAAWSQLGISLDELSGGLVALGMQPVGWKVPHDQPLVLAPWNLDRLTWPPPPSGERAWVFITENPSIVTAALDRTVDRAPQLLCTMGTPSATELASITRLARLGWDIAVRADFDIAGIQHVRAVLAAVPGAGVWRMSASDYLNSLHPAPLQPAVLDLGRLPPSPWDPALHDVMALHARPAYEEALVNELCADLQAGCPGSSRRTLEQASPACHAVCGHSMREDIRR
ncbi:DUF2399 domain-containing protein [Streptomyces sp. NPDC048272]|uniref:DUF2399 domain-containing protein n=1 Tax=Streptomyces sp. NPDC048272 TaxID=3154616 RepID=UPI00341F3F9F